MATLASAIAAIACSSSDGSSSVGVEAIGRAVDLGVAPANTGTRGGGGPGLGLHPAECGTQYCLGGLGGRGGATTGWHSSMMPCLSSSSMGSLVAGF